MSKDNPPMTTIAEDRAALDRLPRYMPNVSIEIRGEGEGSQNTLVGVSPPWETLSAPGRLPGFREIISRDAFDWDLADDILVTAQHNDWMILGRQSSQTAEFESTDEGVQYTVPELPATSFASDLRAGVLARNIRESSFEFFTKSKEYGHDMDGEEWSRMDDGTPLRRILPGGAVPRQFGPVVKAAYVDAPEVVMRCAEIVQRMVPKPAKTIIDMGARNRNRLALAEAEISL